MGTNRVLEGLEQAAREGAPKQDEPSQTRSPRLQSLMQEFTKMQTRDNPRVVPDL